jgi:hypothetical protein
MFNLLLRQAVLVWENLCFTYINDLGG